MGGIFGGAAKSNAAGAQKYTQLTIQTSAYGLPIPIVYGTARLSPNLLDYANFQQRTNGSAVSGKGGTGGGGKGAGSGSTTYSADWLGALCEGPITGLGYMWKSQAQTEPGPENIYFSQGYIGVAPWTYWQDNYPARAIGYSGLSYVGAPSYNLGSSAQLPNFAFEAVGFLAGTAPGAYGANQWVGLPDADPSLVVPDLLTNAQYGAGFPSGRVADLANNSEAHTVPASAPYTVTVAHNGSAFGWNLSVARADGTLLACVSGAPAAGQYSVSAAGDYTFNSAEAGGALSIAYASSAAMAAYQSWCLASGLWLSMALTSQQDAASIVADIGTATHADPVWSAGYLRMVPRGTVDVSGNGHSWSAPAQPVVALTDDDLMPNSNPIGTSASSGNSDPVVLTRKRKSDQINNLKFECLDRANQYAATVVEVSDQALIDKYGRRTSAGRQLHMFCDVQAANRSAALQMQDQYILNTYSFQTDLRFCFLDPGDIISLASSIGALQLSGLWVRITEIQENSDGTLSFAAEEYPTGTGAPPEFVLNAGSGYSADFNGDPGNINAPVLFEPPLLATGETLEVWAAVSGPSALWGGCEVWTATDGVNFTYEATITGAARQGVLTAALPSVTAATTGDTIDTADALAVDLTESNGTLAAVGESAALAYDTLSYVDGELVAYRDATLTATGKYNLGYLVRGVYGSPIGAHAAGSAFARLDGQIARIPFTADRIGQTIQIKFRSFNIYGGGLQDLAAVAAYGYTITGSEMSSPPADVTGLVNAYIGGLTTLQWQPVNDLRAVDYEVRVGGAWASAQFVGRTSQTTFPLQSGDGTYWVAAHVAPTAGIDAYSLGPVSIDVAGATLVRNVVVSHDEGAEGWGGTLSGAVAVAGGAVVTTGGGNVLAEVDFLGEANFLYPTLAASSGVYTSAHTVDCGRAAASYVTVSFVAQGAPYEGDFLSVPDFLGVSDLVQQALSANISAAIQIGLSNDGSAWSWQNCQPGQYNYRYFRLRVNLASLDGQTQAILSGLKWTVDMPDRLDSYVNAAIPAGGLTLQFQPTGSATPVAFIGGPNGAAVPALQVTWTDGQPGDVLVVTGLSLSQATIQILNGGVGVARTAHIMAQGF